MRLRARFINCTCGLRLGSADCEIRDILQRWLLGFLVAVFLAIPAWPQSKGEVLSNLSIEDLMNIEVTSVSKTEQKLSRGRQPRRIYRRASWMVLLSAVLIGGLTGGAPPASGQSSEANVYEIKALFCLTLQDSPNGPPDSSLNEKASIVLCIFGEDPFGSVLDEIVRGKTVEVGAIAPPEILRGVKVLVVDDNPTNRRILEGMLKRWNMDSRQVQSGEEALTELSDAREAGEPYGLILADMHMPKMDGFELIERIRQRPGLSTVTIMMLTSAGHRGDAAHCQELGVAAYLMKPIRQSELREAIARALGAREQQGVIPLVTRYSLGDARDPKAYLHILLAEDNAVNQQLATRLLETRGHHVTVAANGREALEALKKKSYDLVFMDVQMPEMDGLEATAAIREGEKNSGARLPVIALTAHAMKGDRERCLAAGMDDYLSKPILLQELDEVLRKHAPRHMEAANAPEAAGQHK